MSTSMKGFFFAIVSAVTYGLIPLFAVPLKSENISFDAVLGYRFGFSTIFIAVYFLVRKISFRVSLKQFLVLMVLGLIFSLSAVFFFMAYDYLTVGTVATIFFVYPVLVAMSMGIFFKEKITRSIVFAIILSFAGIAVLNADNGGFSVNLKGFVIVLISTLTYALFVIIINKSSAKDLSGTVLTFYSMGFCAVFFMAICLIHKENPVIPSFYTGFKIALFGLVTTTISCVTLALAIKCIGSTLTSIFGAVEPIVAVGVSAFFLGESLTVNLIAAIVLIISAVMIVVRSDSNIAPAIANKSYRT